MKMYGSSKADGGHHLWILSGNGSGRESGSSLSKDVFDPKDTSLLYPPALGTIPFVYWASRVLDPSSKARDGFGLYT